MKQLSESEIKQKFKLAFWDREIDIDELYNTIVEKNQHNYSVDSGLLFSRILISIDFDE